MLRKGGGSVIMRHVGKNVINVNLWSQKKITLSNPSFILSSHYINLNAK
jgi:hypothetical protein